MSLKSLLNQSITVQNPGTTMNKQGDKVPGTATAMRARVQPTNRRVLNKDRESDPIHAVIFTAPDAPLLDGAKITYDGRYYRAMKSDPVPGRNGRIHHYETLAQDWNFGS